MSNALGSTAVRGADNFATYPSDVPLGLAKVYTSGQRLASVVLTIDKSTDLVEWSDYQDWIDNGYTHIQILRTRDGGDEYYVMPRMYDKYGCLITDANGAINIEDNDLFSNFSRDEDVADKIRDGVVSVAEDQTLTQLLYENPDTDWKVFALEAADNQIQVDVDTTKQYVPFETTDYTIAPIVFTSDIADDDTQYCVISSELLAEDSPSPGRDTYRLTISPSLSRTYPIGTTFNVIHISPVLDEEMTPFNTAPAERQNNPPPKASWGAIYQGRLFLVDAENKTRLVFSSRSPGRAH